MGCITSIALLKNDLNATISLSPSLSSNAVLKNGLTVGGSLISELIQQSTILQDQKLTATTVLTNSGVSASICPIIFCIDGGNAYTLSYPPINGLLNGGTA